MTQHRLLFLQTQAALHTGRPEAPERLSRDADSGRPILRPASLLGALRKQMRDGLYDRYRAEADWKRAAAEDPGLSALFGVRDDEDRPANLSVQTGQLLLLPVRSLQGVFTWICSPGVFTGLVQHLAMLDLDPLPEIPNLNPFEALCHETHPCLLDGQHLLLEELSFQRKGDLGSLLAWLSQDGLFGGLEQAGLLPQRLVMVSDTAFDHFMRYAMVPLVRSEPVAERRTRLQHIEMLPPDSWFYTLLSLDESQNWDEHAQALPSYAYIGSHRGTGHGLCALHLIAPKQVPQEAVV